jgi:hypothetical protein
MQDSTTIKQMLAGNKIFVPTYQRAYSWETEINSNKSPKQTNVFISDLETYVNSSTKSSYYFGHFLFEKKAENLFGVIDGQQRITTIIIFLSALYTKLELIRPLNENEQESFEDMIRRNSNYRFSTVDYDNQLFRDYVIDQSKKDRLGLETVSAKRIVKAFDYFIDYLFNKDEEYLTRMLEAVQSATCTTHPVTDESEAIQMFIFQNNRGIKPSNLEIIKAQFMFNVHLYGGEEKDDLIVEIKNRFEQIYKSISSIEYRIDEDDVLVYTLRVYFNSLWEANAIEKINKLLSGENPIPFIKSFTLSLENSFKYLTIFFGKDERDNLEIHSLVTLGGITIVIPFIIKAYQFGLATNQICKLSSQLESIVLRHRLIGTKAYIESRLNDVYENFNDKNTSIEPIIIRLENLKTTKDWWWAYWNNTEFERSIQGGMNRSTAKFLLWKYENYLESLGKNGYTPTRYDKIESPELEHIAPETENPASGYCDYDEEFVNQYLNCLGNYLLLSKSHNCSVGNYPFQTKRNSYNHLTQQREIQKMTPNNEIWSKELISKRKSKIIEFVMKTF